MTPDRQPQPANLATDIAARLLQELARRFPVSCASDEFHYFPQITPDPAGAADWDNYCPASIADITRRLLEWERQLEPLTTESNAPDTRIDAALLTRVARTLRGEWNDLALWRRLPALYLSIASIGLAQALEPADQAPADPAPADHRLALLPDFLDQALANLDQVPPLFRDLGLAMTRDTRDWMKSIPSRPKTEPAIAALDRFEKSLARLTGPDDYTLPPSRLDQVVRDHLGTRTDAAAALVELEREILEMEEIMAEQASRLAPGRTWTEILAKMPFPSLPPDGLLGLYRDEIARLGRHCLDQGLISKPMHRQTPVRVEPVPDYLVSLRGSAAYAAFPVHPPAGGIFYLLVSGAPEQHRDALSRDLRMLSAHETYPGHHLLDAHRWAQDNIVRRHLEFPLFYEGWACFAEEMLFATGYFHGPADRLLLARRHHWRAIRGKIDLALQLKTMTLDQAADLLATSGLDRTHAARLVRTYPAKPGYQICYTIGLRRFRRLFERYGAGRPGAFAGAVFRLGEIEFEDLEKALAGSE